MDWLRGSRLEDTSDYHVTTSQHARRAEGTKTTVKLKAAVVVSRNAKGRPAKKAINTLNLESRS